MTARFEIVRTNARQPWHVREVAGNNEKTWGTETYARREGAERALCRLAERFGWRDVIVRWGDDGKGSLVALGLGTIQAREDGVVVADVDLVDER